MREGQLGRVQETDVCCTGLRQTGPATAGAAEEAAEETHITEAGS
jgi:hypothetical protein